jgi:hypothetical protein
LTDAQAASIERTASPLFFQKDRLSSAAGAFRRFRQRQTDSSPMSHLRTGGAVGGGTQYNYVTPQAFTWKLPDEYNGCTDDAFPKWYPNQAGERTLGHLSTSEPVERHVAIDMFRRAPTARSGQIIFDHGRPNDGYYLQRNSCRTTNTIRIDLLLVCCFLFRTDENTWFHSDVPLNRRHILESIEPKTCAEYEQVHTNQKQQYQYAKGRWPHLSEYGDQFVLRSSTQRTPKIE